MNSSQGDTSDYICLALSSEQTELMIWSAGSPYLSFNKVSQDADRLLYITTRRIYIALQ